jgi:hypothetical protein
MREFLQRIPYGARVVLPFLRQLTREPSAREHNILFYQVLIFPFLLLNH